MTSYDQLETLIRVKSAAEEEAERALGAVLQRRAELLRAQLDLDAAAARAEAELRGARAAGRKIASETAAAALARGQFEARLASDVAARVARASAHRAGALRAAELAVNAARAAHAAARIDREAVAQHLDRKRAEDHQLAERRADDARDDQAEAARAAKPRR